MKGSELGLSKVGQSRPKGRLFALHNFGILHKSLPWGRSHRFFTSTGDGTKGVGSLKNRPSQKCPEPTMGSTLGPALAIENSNSTKETYRYFLCKYSNIVFCGKWWIILHFVEFWQWSLAFDTLLSSKISVINSKLFTSDPDTTFNNVSVLETADPILFRIINQIGMVGTGTCTYYTYVPTVHSYEILTSKSGNPFYVVV